MYTFERITFKIRESFQSVTLITGPVICSHLADALFAGVDVVASFKAALTACT